MGGKGQGQKTSRTKTTTRKQPDPDQSLNVSLSQANADTESNSEIHDQLKNMCTDLSQIKSELADILKKRDIENLIKDTVTEIMKTFEEKMKLEIENSVKNKCTTLQDEIDSLRFDKDELKDEVRKKNGEIEELRKEIKEMSESHDQKINEALKMANNNEQYSRKNNLKIMDVKEEHHENEEMLKDKVCDIVRHQGVELRREEIMAIHRLPTKKPGPKPIIVKTINNNVKTRIMRNRKEMKTAGHRVADDVTKKNTGLISRIFDHDKIVSAWFFNGSVYGETNEGRRLKFDIFDNITDVIERSKYKK